MVVQNQDRIIRRSDYEKPELANKLLVTSMFYTLQGEAPFSGYPAVFLRLAGCNFGNKSLDSACRFCDTYFKYDTGVAVPFEELIEKLVNLKRTSRTMLVVTGGEPTLQHNLLAFIEQYAQSEFELIQIETNGTQAAFFKELRALYDSRSIVEPISTSDPGLHIVCSPKGIYKAGTIPPLSNATLECIQYLKFVIEDLEGSPHYTVPEWALNSGLPVYVSPIAAYKKPYTGEVSSIWDTELIDAERTSKNYAYAAKYCMDHGLRLSVQSHLFTSIP